MQCKQFYIYEFPKKICQASLLISTKYFQNWIRMFCLELWYSVEKYICQHREQHISKRNYEISVVQEIHISRLELQRWPLEFVISFSKEYIWDSGLTYSFWDHVTQISIRQTNFQCKKSKIFCGSIHSL